MPADPYPSRPKLLPQERIIVALDVPTRADALKLVQDLDGLVTFYKVGLELLMSGGLEDLVGMLVKKGRVFLDLKLPADIPETVRRAVHVAAEKGIAFLTLSGSATRQTFEAAIQGRAGRADPRLLFVPFLSSMDPSDFAEQTGQSESEFQGYLEARADKARAWGADGFIVSGQEIKVLRERHPNALLVSPGIRMAGSARDDHKRSCTPAEAIRLGADYLVIGRPIRNAIHRRAAVQSIIDELSGPIAAHSE